MEEVSVLKTIEDSGEATMTITLADDDHKFDVWVDGDLAMVEFDETLSWRGEIRTSEPDDDIYTELMLSDEMTEFLDQHDCEGVKRAKQRV